MPDIRELRSKIDEITLEMIKLLDERTRVAKEIGQIKKESGMPIQDDSREDALYESIAKVCRETGLDENLASRFLGFLLGESVRVQSDGAPTHLSVFAEARKLEASGKKIIHMEVGEPDFAPPDSVRDALLHGYDSGMRKYGNSRGTTDLRKAIARRASDSWNAGVSAKNVIISPGARFAVYSAMTALLNRGDEVIIIEPAWPAYRDCAVQAGARVRAVRTRLEDSWDPSPDMILDALGPRTRMLVLNYPNNPTGRILPDNLFDEIVRIASDRGIYVLSDEIYAQYATRPPRSILEYGYDRGIATQSFSKSHAMTGLRIGCAVGSEEVITRMNRIHSLALTNVPEFIQHAAAESMNHDTSDNTRLMHSRLERLSSLARDAALEFLPPDGAMYVFARRRGIDGARLAKDALKRGLAIAPGAGFGGYDDFVRLSACAETGTLERGMNILSSILNETP